jgi:hypothetical protein
VGRWRRTCELKMPSMAAKPVVKWMASFTTAAMGTRKRYGNDTMGTARSRKGATNKLISPWHRHAAVSENQVEPPLDCRQLHDGTPRLEVWTRPPANPVNSGGAASSSHGDGACMCLPARDLSVMLLISSLSQEC